MRTFAVHFVVVSLILAFVCANDVELLKHFQSGEQRIQIKPRKTTAQRVTEHGYPVETHKVVTEDGYIITTFRIPYSHKLQNEEESRPIVIIQHGLFSCSDGWILNGPDDALPFLLADAGFDVWLGNSRGNTYSRNHAITSVNHPYFWRFSWHEIGFYDMAAIIDYALNNNEYGERSVHYVGHSQGTTNLFVLLSERPEYNEKIKTANMLAPIAFMANMEDKLVRRLAPTLGYYNPYSALLSSQEFVPHNDLFMLLAYNVCGTESNYPVLCSEIAYLFEGDESKTNKSILPLMAETHPAGVSTNQILHYMQEQQSGYFRRFDYGTRRNKDLYDEILPPDYQVQLITAQVHLWYGDNDEMAAVEDVEKLANMLPNKVMHHVEDPSWSHGDFVFAMEVREVINDPLIKVIQEYEAHN